MNLLSSSLIPLTMRTECSKKNILYCLLSCRFWHIVIWLPCVHFIIFFLLLHCSDGLCISHQQSVYEKRSTLGIVSKIFCVSVHNNVCHSVELLWSACGLLYIFPFLEKLFRGEWANFYCYYFLKSWFLDIYEGSVCELVWRNAYQRREVISYSHVHLHSTLNISIF